MNMKMNKEKYKYVTLLQKNYQTSIHFSSMLKLLLTQKDIEMLKLFITSQ